MVKEINDMTLTPIGVVKNELTETGKRDCSDVISEIVIDKKFKDGLAHIDDFSDVTVIYWMHIDNWPDDPKPLQTHPRHDDTLPLVGVFSNRSPDRPNRFGISIARVIELKENVLKVSRLDAINGTKILDIKPWMPRLDSVPDAEVAWWAVAKPADD